MNGRRILFLITLLAIGIELWAQEKPNMKFYGFVRNEAYYDSYKGVDAAMDQFYLLPLYVGKDSQGNHINGQGSAHITAIATRVGVNINGPEVLGAQSMANIETDFAGITGAEPMVLRIRKAFMKLNWEKSSLLVGQTWHPFWGGANFPTVGSLNTGAPFQPFNRSPQIDYTYKMGKVAVSGIVLYENQYVSRGFYTTPNSNKKTLPKRNAVIPELVFSINYKGDALSLGGALQHNSIKPIDVTTGNDGSKFISNELNQSSAAMAFAKYKKGKLSILAKTVYGQNLANLTMLGGYAVKSIDAATGGMTYTNYNHSSSFLNIVYGKQYQIGIFGGYTQNLGTTDAIYLDADANAIAKGLLPNVQSLVRVAPHLAYNVNKFRFVAEYEMTTANYGSGEINQNDGLYNSVESVTNNRILLMMMYFF